MKTLAKLLVNVILTFDGDAPQDFYDAVVFVPRTDTESISTLQEIEVDVIEQILAQAHIQQGMPYLVKISLCYNDSDGADKLVEFLIRNNAKYYFQPNQRDDYEQRIVDRLGVASLTAPIKVAN